MKYKLIKENNSDYSAIEQILSNRGIQLNEISHYLSTTDEDINDAEMLGFENLKAAAAALIKTIHANECAIVIVDADCDGFTSSAILINYLHDLFPSWVENKLHWFLHEGKQHGLSDCYDKIINSQNLLVIVPDAGSNDYEFHKKLKKAGRTCIVLDHHEASYVSSDAIIINNQLSDYPNKELSGAGVTWQFCKFLDKLLNKDIADNYLDLVALGNDADMMSLQSYETKHLINKGFKDENVKNPFIYEMANKNSFSLKGKLTPMGVAFYIAPFVNSMVRSGTQEEKELLFKSMLKYEAFEKIPSTKRGHKPGDMERLVDQAIRTATNVKNRQARTVDVAMKELEQQIKDNNMMEHKVLLFLLEPDKIDKNIAGLCANKIMAKYQRPCCILTRTETKELTDPCQFDIKSQATQTFAIITTYEGSARGCDKVGINNFKDICTDTECIMYAEGHQRSVRSRHYCGKCKQFYYHNR